METLTALCNSAEEYPKSFLTNQAREHITTSYFKRLNGEEHRLFQSPAGEPAIDFWDFGYQARAFWPNTVRNAVELRNKLFAASISRHQDPRCRFMFIHAPNSRDRLAVTKYMLALAFTYHGVMPEFLDFLFGFGLQDYAQDFHYSAFHQQSRICKANRALKIPELGWSGREIQLCYSLKSVEPSESQQNWPWSIRQSAVCHIFDIETGRATWVVVKADHKLKDRVKAATGARGIDEAKSFSTIEKAFTSTLIAHTIFSESSAENWRWYISFLEQKFQATTRHTLSRRVDKLPNPYSPTRKLPSAFEEAAPRLERQYTELSRRETIRSPPANSPPPDVQEHPEPEEQEEQKEKAGPPDFSFPDLQKIQHIEEKATETLLVLKSNAAILAELRGFYHKLSASDDWPDTLTKNCEAQMGNFEADVGRTERELHMHQLRVEALLKLLAERKSLGFGILDFQNMEANRDLAKQAQNSAFNMEAMTWRMNKVTEEMHKIADKTKQETVSMKIITLVTLFFLPGTFISVGLFTLMSTGIFKFDSSGPGILENILGAPNALWFFLTISLPLVVLTFVAWIVFYQFTIHNRTRSQEKDSNRYSDAA